MHSLAALGGLPTAGGKQECTSGTDGRQPEYDQHNPHPPSSLFVGIPSVHGSGLGIRFDKRFRRQLFGMHFNTFWSPSRHPAAERPFVITQGDAPAEPRAGSLSLVAVSLIPEAPFRVNQDRAQT
jgi:hypothetical protein